LITKIAGMTINHFRWRTLLGTCLSMTIMASTMRHLPLDFPRWGGCFTLSLTSAGMGQSSAGQLLHFVVCVLGGFVDGGDAAGVTNYNVGNVALEGVGKFSFGAHAGGQHDGP